MKSKYQLVIEWIKNRIASGELRAGDKVESENEISSIFGMSRQTARHSLVLLEQEGVLVRRQGSGTFVNQSSAALPISRNLSKTIIVISTYVDGYIFLPTLQAMVNTLERENYSVRILFTSNRLSNERDILEQLLKEDSNDPIIVETTMSGLPNPNLDYYRELHHKGLPILFFNSFYPELSLPHISLDDTSAGYVAADYLIRHGHTKIGGIFKADDGQGRRRYQGYLKALCEHSMEIVEDRICWIDTRDQDDFEKVAPRIWNRLRNCTACVCYNDQIAYALTESAKKLGLSIPKDLSLVSIDNSELASRNSVPLTSVSHPMDALGRKAAEQMLQMIKDPTFDATYEFPVELIERASVCSLLDEE